MIPLIFLYDDYSDRPKLSEQKNPFEYIVSPRQVGQNKNTSQKVYFSKFDCKVFSVTKIVTKPIVSQINNNGRQSYERLILL